MTRATAASGGFRSSRRGPVGRTELVKVGLRPVSDQKSGPITERQLLARIRTFAGSPAERYLPR